MRFYLSTCAIIITFVWSIKAVPELEHDKTEIDMHDCRFFTKLTCLRECPKGYVGVYRALCSAAEDEHECCAVRCCRSRHNDEKEDDENEHVNPRGSHTYAAHSRSYFQNK
ncbi:hypothetical protein BC941DRAFT_456466 [Chlamydoabsidia padenii]|nr:hypothetical protein BC941DRAFT_456466 [Chlamydoabsidia padenii]